MITGLVLLLSGLVWNTAAHTGFLAPVLAVFMPAMVADQSPLKRYFRAVVYFSGATLSIIPSVSGFYHGGQSVLGVVLWVAATMLLAAPYIIAGGGSSAVLAVLLPCFLPPIGLIDVVSPLSAAGVLFPATGWLGVFLTLLTIYSLTELYAQPYRSVGDGTVSWEWFTLVPLVVVTLNLCWVIGWTAPGSIAWSSVNTTVPPNRGDYMAEIGNINDLSAAAADAHTKVVLFPEAVLDDVLPGTIRDLQSKIPDGQTWLVGAGDGRYDATLAVTRTDSMRMFASAVPMPVSLWQPFSTDGALATWHEPVQVIDGKRVWAAICYEQVLPWAWFDAMLQQPDVVLLQSNLWWATATNPAPAIQAMQARSWVRLMGVASISASNK